MNRGRHVIDGVSDMAWNIIHGRGTGCVGAHKKQERVTSALVVLHEEALRAGEEAAPVEEAERRRAGRAVPCRRSGAVPTGRMTV